MIDAFFLAVGDALSPRQIRALLLSIAITLAVIIVAVPAIPTLLHTTVQTGHPWLDSGVAALGAAATVGLAWFLFPAFVTVVLSFFLDAIVDGLERQHYPDLPVARGASLGAMVGSALRLLGLTILLNLAAIPFYLIPPLIPFIYGGLNGYLLGRGYFELVTLRRMGRPAIGMAWRRHRGILTLAGVVVALLLLIPVVNLAAPLVATAFMLHLRESLRRRDDSIFISAPTGRYG